MGEYDRKKTSKSNSPNAEYRANHEKIRERRPKTGQVQQAEKRRLDQESHLPVGEFSQLFEEITSPEYFFSDRCKQYKGDSTEHNGGWFNIRHNIRHEKPIIMKRH